MRCVGLSFHGGEHTSESHQQCCFETTKTNESSGLRLSNTMGRQHIETSTTS